MNGGEEMVEPLLAETYAEDKEKRVALQGKQEEWGRIYCGN